MSLDIGYILNRWPYEPGQITARKIRGDDGKEKLQLRLDLGILQMEISGRPDGQRPHGHESLLAYHEHRLAAHRQAEGSDESFHLDERDCELLRNEGTMYYHRYLGLFILEDYDAVVRDANRNLRLMDFCIRYAGDESDQYVLEQYRPYVVMMRTRASGLLALRDNRPKAALRAVKQGIRDIQQARQRFGRNKISIGSTELAILRGLLKEIQKRVPLGPVKRLKRDLGRAVREERFEEAAILRDKLRHLTGDNLAGGGV